MNRTRNWMIIGMLVFVGVLIGVAIVDTNHKLTPELIALEKSLNDWNKLDLQLTAEQATSYLPSGQTLAHIELHQEELSQYGYIAIWSPEKSCFLLKRNSIFKRLLRRYKSWRSKPAAPRTRIETSLGSDSVFGFQPKSKSD